ncbi:MAG: succinate dehydrogenase assembly factor 2 [Betaproteobacteria bacterium]
MAGGERPAQAEADARWLARLRWRCRRGMLENDLILERFLDAGGASLTAADVAALDLLLDLSDNDLWDILSGRTEPADVSLLPLVGRLRSI